MTPALRFLLSCCCALLTLLGGPVAQAQTTRTGAASTDRAEATNWNPATVPTATDDVVIPSGPTNRPTLSSAGAVAKSVQVQSGARLTIASAGSLTVNGNMISPYRTGFYNAGTVENSGQLALGTTASVGSNGQKNRRADCHRPLHQRCLASRRGHVYQRREHHHRGQYARGYHRHYQPGDLQQQRLHGPAKPRR